MVPFNGTGPSCFMALPEDRQEQILGSFEKYVGVCVETVAGGWSLRDDAQVLWRMFKALRVHPCGELMNAFDPGDVIEIYDTDFTQVYRNLAFFSVCSYTLDELLSRPFFELFRRDEKVTGELIKIGAQMIGGQLDGVHQWSMDVHKTQEMESPALYQVEVQEKIASPLQDSTGKVAAILTTLKVISCVSQRKGPELVSDSKPPKAFLPERTEDRDEH